MNTPTILLVEDDPHLRRSTTRNLTAAGFAVHAADTGAGGLRAGEECTFDVGVFDLHLPDIPGVYVAQRLVATERVRRVIFFTGSTSARERKRAAALGHVVSKHDGEAALLRALTSPTPRQEQG